MNNKITYTIEETQLGYELFITTLVTKQFWDKFNYRDSYLLDNGYLVIKGDTFFVSHFEKKFGLFMGAEYVSTKINENINVSNYTIKSRLDSQIIFFRKLEDIDIFVNNVKLMFTLLIKR